MRTELADKDGRRRPKSTRASLASCRRRRGSPGPAEDGVTPKTNDKTMKPLPQSQAALVVRTDFSDHETWEAIGAAILQLTEEGFGAQVEFVDDAAYRGLTMEQLLDLVPEGEERPFFLMIVDDATVRWPEHPILVVDLWHEPGRGFRAVPAAVQSIENNLSIANMDFAEFADAVDEDGIFRGF